MAINPAALKPGAAPPSRELEPEPIDFDKPAQVKTLDSDIAKVGWLLLECLFVFVLVCL